MTQKTGVRHIAPGQIYVQYAQVEKRDVKSAGGLILATTPKDEHAHGKMEFGVVLGCGEYQTRQGDIKTLTNWPLKAGSLVEFKVNNPYRNSRHEAVILSTDVAAVYAPGCWPEYVKE